MTDRLLKVVIVVVTLVWAANFAAPIWNPDYKASPELNAAFMTIVGGLILAGKRGTETQEPPQEPESPTPPRGPTGADPQ